MTVWQDLVSAALVGTERRPFPLSRVSELIDGTPAPIAADGAESQVLAAASLLATYRRAGRRPDRVARQLPDPVGPDHRPVCSDTAAQLLSLLLDGMVPGAGGNTELIHQWLTACVDRGQRPPHRLAVALLELATAQTGLRAAVAGALGGLAEWLGRANSQWAWTASTSLDVDNVEERYARAPRRERISILLQLRACDREAARQLLSSTWAFEPAAERAALLETLSQDLGHDDEPFLEAALDDRAPSVRNAATMLLDRLPRSRRAERMAERARRLVRIDGRFRRRLVVELADELDPSVRRDGITDQRDTGQGLKAAWLTQIVAGTPLDVWETHLSATPEEALRLAAREPELIAGWLQAAQSQRNERWLTALLTRQPTPELLAALPAHRARAFLDEIVTRESVADPLIPLLVEAVPGPWPIGLGAKVIHRVRQLPAILASMTLPTLAARLDPATLPAVEAWIERLPGQHLRRDVQALAHTLSIRQSIKQEFA